MSIDDDIDALSRIPVLAALEREHIRLLVFASEVVELQDGQELFREGAKANSAFVVRSGTLVLSQRATRREYRAGPGAVLGELSLIATTTRPASARAEGEAQLIRIGRSVLRRVLQEYPELAVEMHDMLLRRLADMTRRIGELGDRFE